MCHPTVQKKIPNLNEADDSTEDVLGVSEAAEAVAVLVGDPRPLSSEDMEGRYLDLVRLK